MGIYTDGISTFVPDILHELVRSGLIKLEELGLLLWLMASIPDLNTILTLRELQKHSRVSIPKTKKQLENLAKPFEILNGKGFINFEHLGVNSYKVTLNDIWEDNKNYFKNRKGAYDE